MWWWALTHMGDEGIMLGVVIAEGLVMGWFEAGVKEDGGHIMGTVVLGMIFPIYTFKKEK